MNTYLKNKPRHLQKNQHFQNTWFTSKESIWICVKEKNKIIEKRAIPVITSQMCRLVNMLIYTPSTRAFWHTRRNKEKFSKHGSCEGCSRTPKFRKWKQSNPRHRTKFRVFRQNKGRNRPPGSIRCFICQGPHLATQCPRNKRKGKGKVNEHFAETSQDRKLYQFTLDQNISEENFDFIDIFEDQLLPDDVVYQCFHIQADDSELSEEEESESSDSKEEEEVHECNHLQLADEDEYESPFIFGDYKCFMLQPESSSSSEFEAETASIAESLKPVQRIPLIQLPSEVKRKEKQKVIPQPPAYQTYDWTGKRSVVITDETFDNTPHLSIEENKSLEQ